jgi:hypothetical protein
MPDEPEWASISARESNWLTKKILNEPNRLFDWTNELHRSTTLKVIILCSIGILESNREKKRDLVATGILGGTGILPVILGRLASRAVQPVLPFCITLRSYPLRVQDF